MSVKWIRKFGLNYLVWNKQIQEFIIQPSKKFISTNIICSEMCTQYAQWISYVTCAKVVYNLEKSSGGSLLPGTWYQVWYYYKASSRYQVPANRYSILQGSTSGSSA